jgi:hypothetical protein
MLANVQRIDCMQDEGILVVWTFEELMGKHLKDFCYLN